MLKIDHLRKTYNTFSLDCSLEVKPGCVTGFIHVKLKVRDLLSGIIVMTALYSINMRLAGGRANLPIFTEETIFTNARLTSKIPEGMAPYTVVLILLVIVAVCKILLDLYLKTRSGYLLRAAGDNDTLVTSLAKDKGLVKILGLAIAKEIVTAHEGELFVTSSAEQTVFTVILPGW